MRARLATLATAAALAAAAAVHAQGVAMPPHPDINTTGFSGDRNALPDAVSAIEAASGGRVVEIRYNNVAGAPGYDVVIAKGSNVAFQRFSKPGAGLVDFTDTTKPDWMLKWPARRDVSLVKKAKVSLADAIRSAEAVQPQAPAVAAGIARSASGPTTDVHAFNVAVLQGGKLRRVAIDSETGQVIDDPGALSPW
jgi:hypothetical protein